MVTKTYRLYSQKNKKYEMILTFEVILIPILIFFVSLACQIFIWRFIKINRETMTLFAIYLFGSFSIILIDYDINQKFLMMFLYVGIISAFIQTYPAIRREIPSFKILLLIHSYNRKYIEINDDIILENLSKFNSLDSKINELLQDGFVISKNNSLVLTKTGLIIATFFKIYRKLLGLENGKG